MAKSLGYRIIVTSEDGEEDFDIAAVELEDEIPTDYSVLQKTISLPSLEEIEKEYKEAYPEAFDHPPLWGEGRFPEKYVPIRLDIKQAAMDVAEKLMGARLNEGKTDELKNYLVPCPKCGTFHYRHTGFLEMAYAVSSPKKGVDAGDLSLAVKTCINCKTSIVVSEGTIYNVSEFIKVEDFEKFDRIVNEKYGPSGNCV